MGSGSLGSGSLWITYSKKRNSLNEKLGQIKKTKKRQTKSTNNKSNEKKTETNKIQKKHKDINKQKNKNKQNTND